MDIITMARELGKAIQADERYLALQVAKQNSDDDAALQELIGEFNLKRLALSNEANKEDRDEDKLQKLNLELREVYTHVMENDNMAAYNAVSYTHLDVYKRQAYGCACGMRTVHLRKRGVFLRFYWGNPLTNPRFLYILE